MYQLRRFLATLAILAVSIGIALIMAEAATRYIFRDITTTANAAGYFGQRWFDSIPEKNNSFGFREREINPQKKAGVFRVAVIGDSLTYGQGIAAQARLTNILEKKLNTDAPVYEILNFGKGGAETVDHIEYLKNFVLDIKPDFILLQWFINDVENGDYAGRPKYMRLIPSDRLSTFLYTHSALYFLADSGWQNIQVSLGMGSGYTYNEYMRARFEDADSKDAIRADKALNQFLDLCARNGIPVGIIVFPTLEEGLLDNYPLGFLLDRVLATCSERQIPCVDMRPVFGTVREIDKLRVNRFDGHPGPLANALASQAVYDTFKPLWETLRNQAAPAQFPE